MKDVYLYEDINVMKNLLNIRDVEKLETAESDITYIKLLDIDRLEVNAVFDFDYLKTLHRYIFEDIFQWAGEARTINIEKPEDVLAGISVVYSDYSVLERDIKKVLLEIKTVNWMSMEIEEIIYRFSILTARLWRIHPFREGNTRTTITFMSQFAKTKGFQLNKELLRKNSTYVRKSLVLASIDEYSEYENLVRIMTDAISRS